jgi:hypothetical protein
MAQSIAATSQNGITGAGGGTSFSTAPTWSANTPSGAYNLWLLSFEGNPGTITVSGCTQHGSTGSNGTTCYLAVFEEINASAHTSGTGPTISWANVVNAACAVGISISGTATSSPEDGSDTSLATGNSSSPTAGTITTSNANDCVLGVVAQGAGGTGAATLSAALPSGFTLLWNSVGDSQSGSHGNAAAAIIYQIVTATQSAVTPKCTSSLSELWCGFSFAVKAAAASFDPSSVPWSDTPAVPRPVARLTTAQRQDYPDPTPAFFLSDPGRLDPSSNPVWLPKDDPLPRRVPRLTTAQRQDYPDPVTPLVLPAPINTGDLVDEWRGLPHFLRPVTIKVQDTAEPTFQSVDPIALLAAAVQGELQRPRAAPTLPHDAIESYADPTGGSFLPGPLPVGYPSWMLLDQGPRPIHHLTVSQLQSTADMPPQIPDVHAANYAVFDEPATLPRPVPQAIKGGREDFAPVWSYIAQSQGWDVQSPVPRPLPHLRPESQQSAPVAMPIDDLSSTSGWNRQTDPLPRRLPIIIRGPYESYVGIASAYDPQSLQVPLSQDVQRNLPRPRVQMATDPDPTPWISAVLTALADPHTAALAADSPTLPRRLPRALPGETSFVLDVSQAALPLLPWTDPATLPRRVARLPVLEEVALPPWMSSLSQGPTAIVIVGPYFEEAVQIYIMGDEAVIVSTQ